MYILLYCIVPAAIVFVLQSILCRNIKRGLLRRGALVLPVASAIAGTVTLATQSDDIFGGLGVIAAFLWFAATCSMALGYGAAWLVFFAAKKRGSGKQEG